MLSKQYLQFILRVLTFSNGWTSESKCNLYLLHFVGALFGEMSRIIVPFRF